MMLLRRASLLSRALVSPRARLSTANVLNVSASGREFKGMELEFLGTGSMQSTDTRNVASIAVRLSVRVCVFVRLPAARRRRLRWSLCCLRKLLSLVQRRAVCARFDSIGAARLVFANWVFRARRGSLTAARARSDKSICRARLRSRESRAS